MKILVTNDDGVDNPGLWALVNAVNDLGDVTVVAPADNQSGVGAGLSFRHSVHINEHESRVPGVPTYAVEGTPGDCVAHGIINVLNGDVDVVVAGINPGFNTSRNLFISGTFGAAIIAAANGVKTCAFSMDPEDNIDDPLVGSLITAITSELISPETPRAGLFNVNFPSLWRNSIVGAEGCTPTPSEYKMKLIPHEDGGYEIFSGLKVKIDGLEVPQGTDVEALDRGRVALTALDGPTLNSLQDDPTLQRMIDAANRVIG
jgi:5'-nucleotidase